MATYAAFKHVELYNVGKAKKRVLRPPGGGSTDIFGSDAPPTPRSVRNHMASNIFGSSTDTAVKNSVRQGIHRYYFIGDNTGRRGPKNNDSYSRLFGEPERPFTPAKNHMKSSIPFGPNAETNNIKNTDISSTQSNGYAKNGKFDNVGGDQSNNNSKIDGNPITGDGYNGARAEINTTVPALNGANSMAKKNRIPPGGYSSGLW